MRKEKKWLRKWLSLVLVLAMLLGDVGGIIPVSADENEPAETVATEETTESVTTEPETSEQETEPETMEPETTVPETEPETTAPDATVETTETENDDATVVPDESTPDESTPDESVPEETTEETTEEEETRPEKVETFLVDIELLKGKAARLKELRELLDVSAAPALGVDELEDEPEETEAPDTEEGSVPVLTDEKRQALIEERSALMDEVSMEFGRLCVLYYGNMERVPFFEVEEETSEASEEKYEEASEETDGEGSEVQTPADIRSLLTEEEQAQVDSFLKELFDLLYGVQLLDEDPAQKRIFNLPEGAYGSGSYNLNENDGHHRFFLEYMVDSKTSAGVKRQNTFKVLVKAGEYLCFGSSIKGSSFLGNENEIQLTVNGKTISFDNDGSDGRGYIKTRQQERNGPRLTQADQNDQSRYNPHIYYNETDKDQEVTLVFYSKSRTVSLGTYILASEEFENKQGESTIAAWDITVVGLKQGSDTDYEVKPGRAWSKYLALTTNGNAVARGDMEVHVLTDDNYVYKVNLNQISPFGFIFFANNMGFTHSGNGYDQSIYHSFAANDVNLSSMTTQGINVHNPANKDTGHQKTYNIFFNKPSDEVRAHFNYKSPTVTEIKEISFNGVSDGVTNYKHGGDFTFNVSGATSVEMILDFTDILKEMAKKEDTDTKTKEYSVTKYLEKYVVTTNGTTTYKAGMGIVELNSTVTEGSNTIYWDGKDIHGNYLPVGYYAVQGASAAARIHVKVYAKNAEIHFPMTDVEGLYGGIQIQRLDAAPGDTHAYDIYYNNTPLSQYTYEASSRKGSAVSITNPKNSYGAKFYPITNHTYTYNAPNSSYFNIGGRITTLNADGYTHTPVVSSDPMSGMLFRASGNDGGGNNSGIDVWTYYVPNQEVEFELTTGFAIMEHAATGTISGNIFYDELDANTDKPNGKKDNGESGISGLRVRLVDEYGKPVLHTVPLPIFDEYGDFMWDEEGNILEEEREIEFTAVTDVQGNYTLNGVFFGNSETDKHTYYVQVELNKVQRDTLKYVCTTAWQVPQMVTGWSYTIVDGYCGDGNSLVVPADGTTIPLQNVQYTGYKPDPDDGEEYPEFNKDFAFSIEVSQSSKDGEKYTATAKTIGYTSAIPKDYQESYTVKKIWGDNGQAQASVHEVVVELYVADSSAEPSEGEGQGLNNRRGHLLETVILNGDSSVEAEKWTYTWPVLDSRKQYYFVEYYYMIKEKHHMHGIEEGEWEVERDHQILIGATDVLYSSTTAEGWTTGKPYFGEPSEWHADETDKLIYVDGKPVYEKETTIDTDCLTFKMTYQLEKDTASKKNTVTLKNVQTFDERAYYLWAGKPAELPNFIGRTTWPNKSQKPTFVDEPVTIENDRIRGLKVEWEAGPGWTALTDVTSQFRAQREGGKLKVNVIGTEGTNKPAPGTYTFRATYNDISWALTFHVYDVKDDGTFHYSPLSTKEHVLVGMVEDDEGEPEMRDWLFHNDHYRVELNQNAVDKTMGTCADLVAIGFADGPVSDIAQVEFKDLNLSSQSIPYTPNGGSGVALQINVSKSRDEHTNREEDHVQFTSVSYTPVRGSEIFRQPVYVYYKYVILSEAAIHSKDDSATQSSGSQSGSGTQTDSSTTPESSLVNTVSDSTRGVEMYTYFVLQPIVAELTGATLSVGETIDLNFYMDEDETETHPIDHYSMDFVLDGVVSDGLGNVGGFQRFQSGSNLWQKRQDTVLGKEVMMYGFTFRDLNAYQMGETVTARLWLNEGMGEEGTNILVDERTFSVKQYAYTMLQQKDAVNEPLREMLVDMLNYGTEALRYAVDEHWIVDPGLTVTPPTTDTGGTTQETDAEETPSVTPGSILPNSILGSPLLDRHTQIQTISGEEWQIKQDNTNVTGVAVGLTMLKGMQMSLCFQFRLQEDWSQYKAMLTYPDGHTAEITNVPSDSFVLSGDRQYTIYANGISPFYWTSGDTPGEDGSKGNGKFTLRILNESGNTEFEVEYGVGSYCADMINSTDTNIRTLVKAIYKYGTTAKQWLNTNPANKDEVYESVPTETSESVPVSESASDGTRAA